jgi:hypothetical protein
LLTAAAITTALGYTPYNATNPNNYITVASVTYANLSGAVPTWNQNTSGYAAGLAGGLIGQLPYQSAANTTLFLAAGTAGQAFISGGAAAPTWFAPTAGSVLYAGASGILAQDNSNFFWDGTNHRLGIGTTSPNSPVEISGTSAGTFNGLRITNVNASNGPAVSIWLYTPNATQNNDRSWAIATNYTNDGLLEFMPSASKSLMPISTTVLTLNGVTGLVTVGAGGFKTAGPLVVNVNSGSGGDIALYQNSSTSGFTDLTFNNNSGTWVSSFGYGNALVPSPNYTLLRSKTYIGSFGVDLLIVGGPSSYPVLQCTFSNSNGLATFSGAAVMMPQYTTTAKLALLPAEGWLVYDTTLHHTSYYNGTIWINV